MTTPDEEVNTSNLKFYSLLKEGEKVSNPLGIVRDTFLNSIYRTLTFADNRDDVLSKVKTTVADSFTILANHLANYDANCMKVEYRLKDTHQLILSGLPNLKVTYSADRFFETKIDTLVESINSQVYELMKKHPEVKKIVETHKLFTSVPINDAKVSDVKKDVASDNKKEDNKKECDLKITLKPDSLEQIKVEKPPTKCGTDELPKMPELPPIVHLPQQPGKKTYTPLFESNPLTQ